jgi:hypothetical protein
MTLYHVTPHWNGEELKSLASQLGECDAIDAFMAKWQTDDSSFAQDQVTNIYFYNTLDEAQDHQDEYGGEILAIDDTYLTITMDPIEGYPTSRGPISAHDINRI